MPREIVDIYDNESDDSNEIYFEALAQKYEEERNNFYQELDFKEQTIEQLSNKLHHKEDELDLYKNKLIQTGKDNTVSIELTFPTELKTAIQQYLLYFKVFVKDFKGKEIYFEVDQTENGLRIDFKKGEVAKSDLKEWFSEFYSFFNRRHIELPSHSQDKSDEQIRNINESLKVEVRHLREKLNIALRRCEDADDAQRKAFDTIHNLTNLVGQTFGMKVLGTSQTSKEKIYRVLFLASNPFDKVRLDIEQEIRTIKERICLSRYSDKIDIQICLATRVKDLRHKILNENPDIIHFSGHGNKEGIFLQDEMGNSKLASNESLGELFNYCGDKVKCVILNSCLSSFQAMEIKNFVKYVIAMDVEVLDEASLRFSEGFYDSLGAGKNIDESYRIGKLSLEMEGFQESEIIQLFK